MYNRYNRCMFLFMKTNNFTDDGPKSEDAALFFIGSKNSVSACMPFLFSKKLQRLLAFHPLTTNKNRYRLSEN